LIYKLISPDTSRVSYLMGTMHVSDKRAFVFCPMAAKLIRECSCYLGEMDLSSIDGLLIKKAFTLSNDERYSVQFTPKKFQKRRSIILKSFGIDLLHFDDIAPLFLQSLLASKVLNNDYPYSLDQHLMQLALEANLSLSGLETQEEQYQIAKKLDVNVQMSQFAKLCRNPAAFRKSINHLCELYHQNNEKQLYQSSKKSLGPFRFTMLYERNQVMGKRIMESIKKESSFISVGAGHLQGNQGILSCLKRAKVRCEKLS
jgi:uncharacterized protein